MMITIMITMMSNQPQSNISPDNGLAPNMRQAIFWTNDRLAYWRIYASFSLNKILKIVQHTEYIDTVGTIRSTSYQYCVKSWQVAKNVRKLLTNPAEYIPQNVWFCALLSFDVIIILVLIAVSKIRKIFTSPTYKLLLRFTVIKYVCRSFIPNINYIY